MNDLLETFKHGEYYKSYEYFGAHLKYINGVSGTEFRVWAPNAQSVSVAGDFNGWDAQENEMKKIDGYGIWRAFIPNAHVGQLYKYCITSKNDSQFLKSDPYAFYSEMRPKDASVICELNNYSWHDQKWIKNKGKYNPYKSPMLIYEVHLGSFKRDADGNFLNYRELADKLTEYVLKMGYTHIELLPVSEHPLDASWGYQITGYYSVTSRYGTPSDFKYFIDCCHQKNIGVILDWVPAHFCKDAHGLIKFDGDCLYENSNPQRAENPEWGTLNFDFEKPEVWSFLISNAYFFYDVYHVDGLRVDAVASMIYLDYGRSQSESVKNKYGGNENIEAVAFLKKLNEIIFKDYREALMIAEESTTWPLVTKPTYSGGLGFNFKWNMGWMNDILKYIQLDFEQKKRNHNQLTFSFTYAFSENYILPLSHDEVVHGKKSLIDKVNGEYEEKFAGLRGLYGYMMAHPGKKLVFMGSEFGQFIEWRYYEELQWFLLKYDMHSKLQYFVSKLNKFYLNHEELYEKDCDFDGLDFIDGRDSTNSVITFLRRGDDKQNYIIIISNFGTNYIESYRIGVPENAVYEEVFNTDLEEFGGRGIKNEKPLKAKLLEWHNKPYSIEVKLPPHGTIYIKKIKSIVRRMNNEA